MRELPQVPEQIINRCREFLSEQNGREKMLSYLRTNGASKAQSCLVLANLIDISLGEAQEIVHLSLSWEDVQSRDERLQNTLWEALGQLKGADFKSSD